MRKKGGYGSALIKKRRYCTKVIHGDSINEYFVSKHIGGVGCLSGGWYETDFNVYVFKKPDYTIMMMPNFLGFTVPEGQK